MLEVFEIGAQGSSLSILEQQIYEARWRATTATHDILSQSHHHRHTTSQN